VNPSRPQIAVACGVLRLADGRVLIAQRPQGKIAAGAWEFPGGKIEPGESPGEALARELDEELGIRVRKARPLICVHHDYSDRSVTLHTWLVERWDGEPQSRERQALGWIEPTALDERHYLPTVHAIVPALRLPDQYVFTPPEPDAISTAQLADLPRGCLLRLRWPALNDVDYAARARDWVTAAQSAGMRVLLDRSAALVEALGADGLHWSETRCREVSERPIGPGKLFLGSAHDERALAHLRALAADGGVLGMVSASGTHPDQPGLGWPGFEALAMRAGLPVFAIGGIGPDALEAAWTAGAQGVAGISAWWRSL